MMPNPAANWPGVTTGRASEPRAGPTAGGPAPGSVAAVASRSASAPRTASSSDARTAAGWWPFVGTATRSPDGLTMQPSIGDEGDGLDDLRVTSAPAEIAGDRFADRVLVRPSAGIEVCARRHEHAGRADAALGAAGHEERMLQGVEVRGRRGAAGWLAGWAPGRGPRPSGSRVPATWQIGTRHESTGAPSTRTVQAPHSPSPQPSFVPVRLRSSRRTSSSRRMPGTSTSAVVPLTTKL